MTVSSTDVLCWYDKGRENVIGEYNFVVWQLGMDGRFLTWVCRTCEPALVNPQEDHSAQNQQAANHLNPGQAFAQKEISDQGGESRFQRDDQIGHTGRQVRQADVV